VLEKPRKWVERRIEKVGEFVKETPRAERRRRHPARLNGWRELVQDVDDRDDERGPYYAALSGSPFVLANAEITTGIAGGTVSAWVASAS
jgi:hypothetical protein